MIVFTLTDEQESKYKSWAENHGCKYRNKSFFGGRYVCAFGGADTFIFIQTNTGMFDEVVSS
jgi:hypothetical protein